MTHLSYERRKELLGTRSSGASVQVDDPEASQMMATDAFEVSRRKAGKVRRMTGWFVALVFAQDRAQDGTGALGHPTKWTEVLEIREHGGLGARRVVKNNPLSTFDNVSDAERDYFQLSADEFRRRWFDTAS